MINSELPLKQNKKITYVYFFFVFILGWVILPDYGVTLDDEIYYNNGLHTYEYIKQFTKNIFLKDPISLLIYKERMQEWPILFELILVIISNLIDTTETREIYLLAHKINYLFFFTSLILFFKIIKRRFKGIGLAILATVFFLLSPRIFAESFYNTRDLFFLSLFIYFIYFMFNFINKKNYINLSILSLFSAFLVNSKILGIIPIVLFASLYLFFVLKNHIILREKVKLIILYFFLIFFFSYVLWPYLWTDPLNNLYYAFTNIAKEHDKFVLINYYFGEYISSKIVAWHYRPVWFLITTPVIIIILFFIGIIFTCFKLFKYLNTNLEKNFSVSKDEFIDIFLFLTFFLTLFLTIKFNDSQFGGWRHLYFLYTIVIYFSISAVKNIYQFSKILYRNIFSIIVFANLFYILTWSVINHPNQFVFFNLLAKNYALKNFDLDIWGVSHKQSLDKILKLDTNASIKVFARGFTSLNDTYLFLDKSKKERIIISDFENAKYIIDNKTKRIRNNIIIKNDNFDKFFDINVDNIAISTVYIRKNKLD